VLKNSADFFSKNKLYTFYCLIIVLVFTTLVTLATSAMYSAASGWIGETAGIVFLAVVMFIIGALIDVLLTLWAETFAFIAYRTKS